MSKKCNKEEHIFASYGLSTAYDDFVDNRAVWIAKLTDGTCIVQDDDRPSTAISSAWIRLGHYLSDNPHLKIENIKLRFGTNTIDVVGKKPYYFFSKGLLQAATQTHGLHFAIIGWPTQDKELMCYHYKLPELVVVKEDSRLLSNCLPQQIIGLTGIASMV